MEEIEGAAEKMDSAELSPNLEDHTWSRLLSWLLFERMDGPRCAENMKSWGISGAGI